MGSKFTNADLAREVSQLVRKQASLLGHLCSGMWNPAFCAADGSRCAMLFVQEFRETLDHIERRANPTDEPRSE